MKLLRKTIDKNIAPSLSSGAIIIIYGKTVHQQTRLPNPMATLFDALTCSKLSSRSSPRRMASIRGLICGEDVPPSWRLSHASDAMRICGAGSGARGTEYPKASAIGLGRA